MRSVEKVWTQKVAHRQNCSYLAVKAASSFMCSPADDCKMPERSDVFGKKKSTTEQHREEERSALEWLRVWGEIKVKPCSGARAQYVPKRPTIVSTT